MKKGRKKYIVYLVLTLLIIMTIFAFSSQPAAVSYKVSSGATQQFNNVVNKVVELDAWRSIRTFIWRNNRKIAHIFLYMCLGWCAFQTTNLFVKRKVYLKYIFALCFSLLIAIGDEIHQSFVPGRDASFSDVMIDSIGIVFSLFIAAIIGFVRYKKLRGDKN